MLQTENKSVHMIMAIGSKSVSRLFQYCRHS